MTNLRPTMYFPHDDAASKHLIEKCKDVGYNVTTELPNFTKWNTFFYVTHELAVYAEFREPSNVQPFICIIMYHFLIDDVKDHHVLENFFNAFMAGREFYFPRSGGLLKHFVIPMKE